MTKIRGAAPTTPAGHRSSAAPPLRAPGDQPVPVPDPAGEIEELAALLADVVELTRGRAVYPCHLAAVAEQAQHHASVRRALRDQQ